MGASVSRLMYNYVIFSVTKSVLSLSPPPPSPPHALPIFITKVLGYKPLLKKKIASHHIILCVLKFDTHKKTFRWIEYKHSIMLLTKFLIDFHFHLMFTHIMDSFNQLPNRDIFPILKPPNKHVSKTVPYFVYSSSIILLNGI